jgi:hypothetical protein
MDMENGDSITKADLQAALADFRHALVEDLHNKAQQIRLGSLEAGDAAIIERPAIIEERLLHLEARRPPTV